jgi:hypothetical protein
MNEALKQHILGMVGEPLNRSKKMEAILAEWDIYFKRLCISEDKQKEEFHGIMRVRFWRGVISVRAPDIDSVLKQKKIEIY